MFYPELQVSPYNIGSHRLRLSRPIYSGQEQQQKKDQQQQEQPQSPPPRMNRNFISNFVDNIKEEMRRNKELQVFFMFTKITPKMFRKTKSNWKSG